MKFLFNDCTIDTSYIKSNIMRCSITKGAPVKNDSLLIEPGVFELAGDKIGTRLLDAKMAWDSVAWSENSGKELFQLKSCSLEDIDVIKYSTQGEEPRVEVLKTVDGERTQIANLQPYMDRKAYHGSVSFLIPGDTGIFGLGQDEDGVYNHRGKISYLYQHNMRIPIPFIVTDKGWGILFDCPSLMIVDDTGKETVVCLDTVDQIDFFVITGTMDTMISGFRYLTGRAEMLPKWAFGYIQCKERYQTQDEMIAVARKYRELGVPLDCVVQDWKSWPELQWGQKTVDKERYPDLREMNRVLHEMNVHTMVSVWPIMAAGCPDHKEMAEKGYLLGDYTTYNAFDEDARRLYWQQAERELFKGGFDAWWCDSSEPFTAPDWCGEVKLPEEKRFELVGGEHKKFLDPALANFYAVMHAKGIFENQRRADGTKRVLNLTRSGYPGIQKYGTVLWGGDTSARWEVLRQEITKGLNICMSGIPYWTVDIGAFFVGGVESWRKWCGNPEAKPVWFWNGEYDRGVADPAYCELYTRWLQLGAFLPVFRSHGTDTPREIWNFGNPGDMFYDAIEKAIHLRYSFLPYIYSMAARATFDGYTIMRSLLFDFPGDKMASKCVDEFMFGDSILVCPVIKPMYYDHSGAIDAEKTRLCYLPAGADWVDFWSGAQYTGGQTVPAGAALDQIPLFIRSGSILLMQEGTQSAMDTPEHIDVRIFGGCDTQCIYYDDDGTSYKYNDGAYQMLLFSWNDSLQLLTVCDRGEVLPRPLQLHIHYNDRTEKVHFAGGKLSVQFSRM